MTGPVGYLPVSAVLPPGLVPTGLVDGGALGFLDDLACEYFDVAAVGEDPLADDPPGLGGFEAFLRCRVMAEARIGLSFLPGLALVLGRGDSAETGSVDVTVSVRTLPDDPPDILVRVTTTVLSLALDRALARPVEVSEVDGSLVVTELPGTVSVPLPVDLLVRYRDEQWSLDVDLPAGEVTPLSLPPAVLGNTDVVVELSGLVLSLSGDGPRPPGAAPGWAGILAETARVYLRPLVDGAITVSGLGLGAGGFWGTVAAEFPLSHDPATNTFTGPLAGGVLGFAGGVRSVRLGLVQNVPTALSVEAELLVPWFDQPIAITAGLDAAGGLTVALAAAGGLAELVIPDVLRIVVRGVRLTVGPGGVRLGLSGTLTPVVPGLTWPSVEVRELSVGADGAIHLDGGWLDLPDQAALDLGGFTLEIARIGFGTEDDGRRWVGFSGGLRLVEGLSAGASVDGLRLSWRPGTVDVGLALEGVGVEFEVPGAVAFRGAVSMTRPAPGVTRFDGSVVLELIALDLELEAQIVVGYDAAEGFPFIALYLGVELPAGIPLGQTGLGLFGLAGLFALHMEPGRAADEAWYSVNPPSWYHAAPVGVTGLTKWAPRQGSLALGAGITLGTVVDNGFTFAGRFLLGIVFPGPILFLEGRANLLAERTTLAEEPVLRALAVLDARAGTVQVGLDAAYRFAEGGELIDLGGSAEAFFAGPDDWHVYLGVDEPRDRRIRAEIFARLFEANAFLMIDPTGLRTGAWIGYDADWRFGPLSIELEAWLEGRAGLSVKPPHFSGALTLHGSIAARVFGIGFELSADATLAAEVFDPMSIRAELSVRIGLPWPLPDVGADIELQWGPEPDPPLLPVPLVEAAVEHPLTGTSWPLRADAGLLDPAPDPDGDGFFAGPPPAGPSDTTPPPDSAPVVSLDARPQLTFGRPVHDVALVGVNPSSVAPGSTPEPGWDWIGDPARNEGPARVRLALTEVRLDRWDGSRWQVIARKATDANPVGVPSLYGSWAPLPAGPDSVGNVALRVWSRSPYDWSRHTGGAWDQWFDQAHPGHPCVEFPVDVQLCCRPDDHLPPGTVPSAPWSCPEHPIDVTWGSPPDPVAVPGGLRFDGEAVVLLRRAALQVEVTAGAPTGHDVDLRGEPVRDLPNPVVVDAVRFTVLESGGGPAAGARIVAWTAAGGHGLDVGAVVLVDLAFAADALEVLLTHFNVGALLTAFDAAGGLVDQARMTGPVGAPETVRLARRAGTAEIRSLRIEAPGHEVVLHQLRWAGTGQVRLTSYDRAGRVLGTAQGTGGPLALPGRDVVRLTVASDGPFVLEQVCLTVGLDAAEHLRREELLRHVRDEVARWSADGELLPAHAQLRLLVTTTVEVRDFPHDPGFDGTRTFRTAAHFRTQGPPGLATLSAPEGHPVGAPPFVGVDTLDAYVAATAPTRGVDVPPRPVYRAYDVAVAFRTDDVEQMYAAAGRDLVLRIVDANGRAVETPNLWGRRDTLALSASEERWLIHLAGAGCVPVDFSMISRPLTLTAGGEGHVLPPVALHQAQLIPLLARESFSGYPPGARARGTAAALRPAVGAGWSVLDEGTHEGPSDWIVRADGVPPSFAVEQISNVSSGPAARDDAFPGGTLLVRGPDPRLAADSVDQPERWSDLRAAVFARSADDDLVGIAVRWTGRSGYLATTDRERGRRRLVAVVDGVGEVLAEVQGTDPPGFDVRLALEAVGDRLRFEVDGRVVLEAVDARFAAGSVGLYCGACAGTRFTDVRVDDLRADVPVVHRLDFTTSAFTDLCHHLGSGDDTVVTADVGGVLAMAGAAAVPAATAGPDVGEAEARAHDAVVAAALGGEVHRQLDRPELVRLTEAGGTVGLLLRTGDPLSWARTALALGRADGTAAPDARRARTAEPRLLTASFTEPTGAANDEGVTILLAEATDLTGWRVQRRPVTDPETDPQEWDDWYVLPAGAGVRPAGRRVRVLGGRAEDPQPSSGGAGEEREFRGAAAPELGEAGADLRLVDPDGIPRHTRRARPDAAWTDEPAATVLRRADGTAVVVLVPDPATGAPTPLDGPARLRVRFRRDNRAVVPDDGVLAQAGDTSDEVADVEFG